MADDPRVGIVMGSDSDWPVMESAAMRVGRPSISVDGCRSVPACGVSK